MPGSVARADACGGTWRDDTPQIVRSTSAGPDGRFYVTSTVGVTAYEADDGDPVWAVPIGGYGSLSSDGQRLFVLGGGLFALDTTDGTTLWSQSGWYGHDIQQSPDGSIVYVLSYQHLHAFDTTTGSLLWSLYLWWADFFPEPMKMAVDPTGTRVFIAYLAGNADDLEVRAYNAVTGEGLWTYLHLYPQIGARVAGLAAHPDGKSVHVAWTGGLGIPAYRVVALDASTGDERWSDVYRPLGFDAGAVAAGIALSPDGTTTFVTGFTYAWLTPGGDELPVGSSTGYTTVAYDALTGARRWASTVDEHPSHYGPPAAAIASNPNARELYVTTDRTLVAVEPLTGAQTWTMPGPARQTDIGSNRIRMSVSTDGNRIVLGDASVVSYETQGPVLGTIRDRVEPNAGPAQGPVQDARCAARAMKSGPEAAPPWHRSGSPHALVADSESHAIPYVGSRPTVQETEEI